MAASLPYLASNKNIEHLFGTIASAKVPDRFTQEFLSSTIGLTGSNDVMDHSWKEGFDELVRDKALIQGARMIVHLRNTICHMTDIPPEETERVRQSMRDWFRVIAP